MKGKQKLTDRPVKWHINIPTSVAKEFAASIEDPITGKPIHGARGSIITKLVREHLAKQKQGLPSDRYMARVVRETHLKGDSIQGILFVLLDRLGYGQTVLIAQKLLPTQQEEESDTTS